MQVSTHRIVLNWILNHLLVFKLSLEVKYMNICKYFFCMVRCELIIEIVRRSNSVIRTLHGSKIDKCKNKLPTKPFTYCLRSRKSRFSFRLSYQYLRATSNHSTFGSSQPNRRVSATSLLMVVSSQLTTPIKVLFKVKKNSLTINLPDTISPPIK